MAGLVCAGVASAATAPAPTISPAPGNVANSLNYVDITWPGSEVTIPDKAAFEKGVTVLLNGEVPDDYTFEYYYSLIDEYGWEIWDPSETAIGIRITMPWFWDPEGSLDCTYNIDIEAGIIAVKDASGATLENPALNLAYNVIGIEEVSTVPSKGSVLTSLSEFDITWGDWKLARNPDCTENITLNVAYSYEIEATNVTVAADGSKATVTLESPIGTQGWINGTIPAGYFILSKDGVEILSPESPDITYNISVYSTVPANFNTLREPFDTFCIYGDTPELTGSLADIKMIDPDTEEEIASASSYTEVKDEETEKDGLQFEFPTSISGWTSVIVLIPANTLSFGGTPYASEIKMEYFIHQLPEPNVNPAAGTDVVTLDKVEIDWNNTVLNDNSLWNEDLVATISYNGGAAQDISQYVTVETEYEIVDNPYWGPQEEAVSSKIVVDFGENPYTEEGDYVISIPEGWVSLSEYDYAESPELTLTFTVNKNANNFMEAGVVTDPQGKYQSSLGNVIVAWEDEEIKVYDNATVTLVFNDKEYELSAKPLYMGHEEEPAVPMADNEDIYNAISIDMPPFELFGQAGEYKYIIPAKILKNANGFMNPTQEFSFFVLPTTSIEPTVTPAIELNYGYGEATVASLEKVTVSWNAQPLQIVESQEIRLDDIVLASELSVVENVLNIDLSSLVTENGTYSVIIPEGSVVINETELNSELVLTYTTTDQSFVEFVEAEADGLYRVYNLNGVNVITTDNASELSKLANGIYIVNGKKVILNK